MSKSCVIIPCRFASTRFEGKPLALLDNKHLMSYPYEAALKAKTISDVYIATDDERISSICKKLGMNFIITDPKHSCGTDRVAEAFEKLDGKYENIINVQGDEPFISSTEIDDCNNFLNSNKSYSAVNGIAHITKMEDLLNTGVVKVVINIHKRILYLSRMAVPHPFIKKININYFRQLGLYGFKSDALDIFKKNDPGNLEKCESVEMLRLLEQNFYLFGFITSVNGPAVDTANDLKNANLLLTENIY